MAKRNFTSLEILALCNGEVVKYGFSAVSIKDG